MDKTLWTYNIEAEVLWYQIKQCEVDNNENINLGLVAVALVVYGNLDIGAHVGSNLWY